MGGDIGGGGGIGGSGSGDGSEGRVQMGGVDEERISFEYWVTVLAELYINGINVHYVKRVDL